jgi:hypothetical protein
MSDTPAENQTTPVVDENQLIAERRSKLKALREAQAQGKGVAFPNDFKPEHRAGDLTAAHGDKASEALKGEGVTPVTAKIAGRMMLKRVMGKASFATLQDATGRFQIYVTRDDIGEEAYNDFKHWDLGDIVAAEGYLFKTKMGELSLHASSVRMLTKSLRPMPDKFHGVADQEIKYRQRDVDLNGFCHSHHRNIKKHNRPEKTMRSLGRRLPELAKKMIVGDPFFLISSSLFKATWKCDCGNMFIQRVQYVVNKFLKCGKLQCPKCMPKKEALSKKPLTKSFFTQYPDLIKHSICKLDFSKIACKSPLPVLWKCTVCENPYWLSVNDMQRRAKQGSYLVCNCCTAGGSFRRDDLGWMYLITRPGQLKVGITNTVNGTGNRMKRHRKNGWMQLDMIGPMNGEAAHQLELRIKLPAVRTAGTLRACAHKRTQNRNMPY